MLTDYILNRAHEMTTEQRADELIAKYGMPLNEEALHALLCYMHQQGKVDGCEEAAVAIKQSFQLRAITG